jgi:hypothetical protein
MIPLVLASVLALQAQGLQVEAGWGPHAVLAARVVVAHLAQCVQVQQGLLRVDVGVRHVARFQSWQDRWSVELRSVQVTAVLVVPGRPEPVVAEASEVVPSGSWGGWDAGWGFGGEVSAAVVTRLAARVGQRLWAQMRCELPRFPARPEPAPLPIDPGRG